MPRKKPKAQLLVEGKNDQHVIWALCQQHNVPKTFTVEIPGMLEDFVAHLIPDGDLLAPKAKAILQDIEEENLNLYIPQHQAKAFIHTWLAWQKTPGRPMGQSITAHVLQYDKPLANTFVAWLKRLFI